MTLWHDIRDVLRGQKYFLSADEIIKKLEKAGRQSRSEIVRQKLKKLSTNGDVVKLECLTKQGRLFVYMWHEDFKRDYVDNPLFKQ